MTGLEYLSALIEGQEVPEAVPIKKAELKLLLKILQQEEQKRSNYSPKETSFP